MELRKARKLGNDLLVKWRLAPKWTFGFDNAKRRFGQCKLRSKRINLSRHLTKLNEEKDVKDTILHEIAHALDYEDRGTSDHSAKWKKWARKVGASPTRCYDTKKVTVVPAKYYDYCPSCGNKSRRHKRRTSKKLIASCGHCSKGFNPEYLVVFNIPRADMEKIENSQLNWKCTQAAQNIKRALEKTYPFSYEDNAFYKKLDTPIVKSAARNPAPTKSASRSNKEVVYEAWKNGEQDADALHNLIGGAVKLSTVKGWLNKWPKGKGLPAVAKG